MKNNFKKITAIAAGALMVGMTMGNAVALSPSDNAFDAVVYGAQADNSDQMSAESIASWLGFNGGTTSTTTVGGEGETEEEVVFGTQIDASGYEVETTMTDANIPTLLDEKLSWDDGLGSTDYDIHESIVIGDMEILTSLDDEDLEGVAMSNNMGLSYRYVFDDALNCTGIGHTAADDLYLTILGKSYEIEDMTTTTITVVTSEDTLLSVGESYTVDGKTFTLDDVWSDGIMVNAEVIDDGQSKKIDGIRVKADSIIYHSDTPETSRAILKIGTDISKTYSDGDEYIGEDEDDPLWVWDISTACTAAGYVGVTYNVNINDADDSEAGDSIKYVGESYVLPEGFAAATLEGTTDVDYEDITIEFADIDLYNSSDNPVANEDEKVIVISASTTSSITVGGEETDKIYLWYAENGSETESYGNTYGAVEVFYRDHDGDNTPTNKARYEMNANLTATQTLARANVATVEIGDTVMDIDVTVASGVMTLSLEDPDDDDINFTIGGTTLADEAGTLEKLGTTAEDADANDILVSGTDVSTKDKSIMNDYGIIVAEDDSSGVEGNADADKVIISIPDEKVYAQVSVLGGISTDTTTSGSMIFTDSDKSSWANKNVILVGGSCINTATAEALGVSAGTCDAAFTGATNVGTGQYIIKVVGDAFTTGKTALVVAGYEKENTEAAVSYLKSNVNRDPMIEVADGNTYFGTTGVSGTSTVTKTA